MHVEDHVRRCWERFGHTDPKFCERVHQWVDAPYETIILAPIHRLWRHDPAQTPEEALELFGWPSHECVIGHILDDQISTGGFLAAMTTAIGVPVVAALAFAEDP